MSKLLALKNRKKVIETIYRASSAMKAAASVRVRKIEKSMSEFEKSFDLIQRNSALVLEQLFLPFVMNTKSTARANIIIGCDTGMCGDFASMIKNYFKLQITLEDQNLEKAIEDKTGENYWLVFGSKLENVSTRENVKYMGNVSIEGGKILADVIVVLWDFIHEKQITELVIHHFYKNEIIKHVVFSKQKLMEAFIKNDEVEVNILKSRVVENKKMDMNLITYEYGGFFLASVIYKAFLSSLYEENKQRIYAMSQAKTNAESMGKVIDRLYNRARQEKITMELNEITAGII